MKGAARAFFRSPPSNLRHQVLSVIDAGMKHGWEIQPADDGAHQSRSNAVDLSETFTRTQAVASEFRDFIQAVPYLA